MMNLVTSLMYFFHLFISYVLTFYGCAVNVSMSLGAVLQQERESVCVLVKFLFGSI